jgi:AcrR family transcriptional regulator
MKGTKELIIKTARKLFGKFGLKKTTVDAIAKEAKIGKGTIYHYYESKEEIFQTILSTDVEEVVNELKKAAENETDPSKKLKLYVKARIKSVGRFASFYAMFKEEYIDFYGYIKKVEDKYYETGFNTIKQFIREGNEQGIFAVEDIDLAAFFIQQSLKALEYHYAMENEEEVERKMDKLLDLGYKGFLKR